MLRTPLLLFSLFVLLAGHAPGQQIRGTIRDASTGEVLVGTLLVVLDAHSVIRATTLSDEAGTFFLHPPASDTLRLRVHHVGYTPERSIPIVMERVDTLELAIGLRPDPVTVEGVTVRAPRNANHQRFLRRQKAGFGTYLGPEHLAMLKPTSISTLLLSMPGAFLLPGSGPTGQGVRAKGLGESKLCTPAVYVDGWKQPPGFPLDAAASARDVRAVEVYRNPKHAPAEFQEAWMGSCPIIVIWTALGFAELN